MDTKAQYLISKDNGKLQIPYNEYILLMHRVDEAKRVMRVKNEVLASLKQKLEELHAQDQLAVDMQPAEKAAAADAENRAEPVVEHVAESAEEPKVEDEPEKVSIEFSYDGQNQAATNEETTSKPEAVAGRQKSQYEIPPIKKEIVEHFNARDASGRLFNVFKQYYTCLNETCGGTVCVTMKDGVCSLLNYDEWEEFAFVDIYENDLRFAVDPRYTNDLSALNFCEVSRLLASRRSLVSIQVGDLNKTMLGTLVKAFNEIGQPTS